MKKQIIYIIAFLLFVLSYSCYEDQIDGLYIQKPALYFLNDSVNISLAGKADMDTLYLPVQLLGQMPSDVNFKLVVNQENITAIENTHFIGLNDTYAFTPDSTMLFNLPVLLLTTDTLLFDTSFYFSVKLVENENFDIAFTDKQEFEIIITKQLVIPEYWSDFVFGPYSKVKHNKLIEYAGKDFPETSGEYYANLSFWQAISLQTSNFYADELALGVEHYDENGDLISPW